MCTQFEGICSVFGGIQEYRTGRLDNNRKLALLERRHGRIWPQRPLPLGSFLCLETLILRGIFVTLFSNNKQKDERKMKKKKHLQKDNSSEIIELLSENSTGKHDECMVWNGRRDARGYGVISGVGERSKKTGAPKSSLAHRVSYTVHKGPIPDGLCVCHHCDNPPCINPLHLFLGTRGDNIRDCIEKGRRPKSYKKQIVTK